MMDTLYLGGRMFLPLCEQVLSLILIGLNLQRKKGFSFLKTKIDSTEAFFSMI